MEAITLKINSILVNDGLPLRKGGKLLSSELFPKKQLGLFAAISKRDQLLSISYTISNSLQETMKKEPYFLQGKSSVASTILFVSDVLELDEGRNNTRVYMNEPPLENWFLEEVIIWEIVSGKEKKIIAKAETTLRLCLLSKIPIGANTGIPYEEIELMEQRFATLNSRSIIENSQEEISKRVAAIVNQLFESKGLKYDINGGRSKFAKKRGRAIYLDYSKYIELLNTPGETCNCQDMAALLWYKLNIAGIEAKYAYLKPFGYITKTRLIGREETNNPLYGLNQAINPETKKRNPYYGVKKMIGANKPIIGPINIFRTAFSFHAFVYIEETKTVADACAGPHIGNELIDKYRNTVIDKIEPSKKIGERIKILHKFRDENAVIKYRTVKIQNKEKTENRKTKNRKTKNNSELENPVFFSSMEKRGFDVSSLNQECYHFISVPKLQDYPFLKEVFDENWSVLTDKVEENNDFTSKHTVLITDNKSLRLTIWMACESCDTALKKYADVWSNHSSIEPIFDEGPKTLGELSGQFIGKEDINYIWIARNIVFNLEAYQLEQKEVREIAEWLYNSVADQTPAFSRSVSPITPIIESIEVNNDQVKVGDIVEITVKYKGRGSISYTGDYSGLYIKEENDDFFSFRAKKISQNYITIHIIDPITLRSDKKEIDINVY